MEEREEDKGDGEQQISRDAEREHANSSMQQAKQGSTNRREEERAERSEEDPEEKAEERLAKTQEDGKQDRAQAERNQASDDVLKRDVPSDDQRTLGLALMHTEREQRQAEKKAETENREVLEKLSEAIEEANRESTSNRAGETDRQRETERERDG